MVAGAVKRLALASALSIAAGAASVLSYINTGAVPEVFFAVPIGAAFALLKGWLWKLVGAVFCLGVAFATVPVVSLLI